jgi:beta-1,4-N-acetylglucosaminyltransferase
MNKKKTVFLTVGSTKFESLVDRLLDDDILEILNSNGFNQLIMQVGNGKHKNKNIVDLHSPKAFETRFKQAVYVYNYKTTIVDDLRAADLVISHAGAGSIIESLELNKQVIVVVNEALMDNHQYELAEKMQSEHYLIHSLCKDLGEKIKFLFDNLNWLRAYDKGKPELFSIYLDRLCFASQNTAQNKQT